MGAGGFPVRQDPHFTISLGLPYFHGCIDKTPRREPVGFYFASTSVAILCVILSFCVSCIIVIVQLILSSFLFSATQPALHPGFFNLHLHRL